MFAWRPFCAARYLAGAEDPGPGLLDRQNIFAGDLELDLHGELLAGSDAIQLLELVMDRFEMTAQLTQLGVAHEELSRGNLIGARGNGVGAVRVQQHFLRHRVCLGLVTRSSTSCVLT